jgi:MFS family permease
MADAHSHDPSLHPPQVQQRSDANIPKYFVYTALKGLNFGLITAIWVIFVQGRHGMSLTQVTLLDVAFWIAATLGEVPTGMVADTYGRKASLAVGVAIMGVSIIAFGLVPTVPLVVLSYVTLAIGVTFLSGAEDAFVFESLKGAGRVGDYTKVAGRISATTLAAVAVGNLSSGFLATVDLRLPIVLGGTLLLAMLGIVITFREPPREVATGDARAGYWSVLRGALGMMRARPTLRYPIFYLTLIPITAMILETVFLQPQALALGVPLAGVGVVIMGAQLANMAGAANSHWLKGRVGERTLIYLLPFVIAACLLLLGTFQYVPALLFAAAISFCTALLRPLVMNRIQNEVEDKVRATVLSMQSLLFAFVVTFVEPALGYLADLRGLPISYYALAGGLATLMLALLWRSRAHFP